LWGKKKTIEELILEINDKKHIKYQLEESNYFSRKANKLLNKSIRQSLMFSILYLLAINPFDSKLDTHKLSFRDDYSSWIDKKFRLIWYNPKRENPTIILKNIGNHDNVY